MPNSIDSSLQSPLLAALAARGIPPELLRSTSERWHLRTIEGGRVHVRHGQRAQAIFFVLKGELTVRARKLEVARIEPGALVGIAPCISKNGTYPHELAAARRTVVAELPLEALLELRRAGDGAYDALLGLELRTLAERIGQTGERLASIRSGTFPLLTRAPGSVLGRLWQRLRVRSDGCPPIEPLLRALPGLGHASEAVIAEIAGGFRPRPAIAREVIALEGEPENSLYLIAGGQVDVLRKTNNGAMIMLAALREGALFGMVSLLSGLPRNASCVAAEEVKLYKMTQDAYAALGPESGRAWRECLVAVLHRQLREACTSVVAALRVFETTGTGGSPPLSDPSLLMLVEACAADDEGKADDDID